MNFPGDTCPNFNTILIKEFMVLENSTTQLRQQLFITLYEEAFPTASVFIKKMGGTLEDAKDIFQDALMIYYEKVTAREFVIHHNDKTYLLGICKHLWYKKYKDNRHLVQADAWMELNQKGERETFVSENILQFIERSGKKCMELLQTFYFEKRTMKEIAALFGFSGERSATAQKYKCLEKIRNIIKDKSLNKEDFYE